MKMRLLSVIPALVLGGWLAGCAVGPNYQRAEVPTPPAFAEAGPWKQAAPADELAKGDWWTVFNDAPLNDLEGKATQSNQQLQAAIARVDQARSISRVARSELFPTVTTDPAGEELRNSPNATQTLPGQSSDVRVPVDLTYEVDAWGRVRRTVEAAQAGVQASVADEETVRLTLHAEVAQNYFTLRATDSELAILTSAIDLRQQELDLIRARYQAGSSSDLDVSRAETELTDAKAELATVRERRAELEHALAVLEGAAAESFHIAASPLGGVPPAIPQGVPSDLLERRPDVASAERTMAATNAQIGVAKAAFFPVIQLTGAAGFESADLGSLFDWSSRVWSIGPSVSLPIFDGGKNTANLNRSEAAYDEAVANYRQQVLTSFAEVENGLSSLRNLSDQAAAEQSSVDSSQRAYKLSDLRYKTGTDTYLDVIDAERSALQSQRAAAQTLGQRYVSSVLLVKALGGGWRDSAIHAFASTEPSQPQPTPAP